MEATIQSAQRVYAALGFSNSRSALLAHAAIGWHSVVQMDVSWVALPCSSEDPHRRRVFEALLRFFGAGARSRRIRAVEFSDIDGENIVRPSCGLPLLRYLERTA